MRSDFVINKSAFTNIGSDNVLNLHNVSMLKCWNESNLKIENQLQNLSATGKPTKLRLFIVLTASSTSVAHNANFSRYSKKMRYKDFAQVLFLLATATGFRPLWMAKSPLNLMLNFKSSVEDKPMSLQPQSGLTYRVKEASFHDLSSVIMLRLVVFYPTVRIVHVLLYCLTLALFSGYFSWGQTNSSKQDCLISSVEGLSKDQSVIWPQKMAQSLDYTLAIW